MGLKHDIIDMAVSLLHLLEHCDDEDFLNILLKQFITMIQCRFMTWRIH